MTIIIYKEMVNGVLHFHFMNPETNEVIMRIEANAKTKERLTQFIWSPEFSAVIIDADVGYTPKTLSPNSVVSAQIEARYG